MEGYDAIARYYDLDFMGFTGDVELYLNYARLYDSPVLEVGCGTGRVVTPLAQGGFAVVGIDSSAAMLELARRKLAGQQELEERVTLMQADMRDFALERRFGMAIYALNTFMHLVEPQDQERSLACVRRHLQLGGMLFIDVQNPHQGLLTEEDGVVYHVYTRTDEYTGHVVSKFYARQLNRAQQVSYLTVFYDELSAEGEVRRTLSSMRLRYWYPAEMLALLEHGGFRVEHVYGSYNLEELQAESPRLIFVAARK